MLCLRSIRRGGWAAILSLPSSAYRPRCPDHRLVTAIFTEQTKIYLRRSRYGTQCKSNDHSPAKNAPQHHTLTLTRVIFHNAANGYSVLRGKLAGEKGEQIVLCHVPDPKYKVQVGEVFYVKGSWENNKHGYAVWKAISGDKVYVDSAQRLRLRGSISGMPTMLEVSSLLYLETSVEKYLSAFVDGIGSHIASKLVNHFGASKVLEVIQKEPHRLKEITGIGAKRIKRIVSSYNDRISARRVMDFFIQHGFASSVAMRMWRRHGDDTVNIVTKNPYLLASSAFALTGSEGSDEKGGSGLSFKQADMLAHRLGFSRDSPIRLRAGIVQAVHEYCSTGGHCAMPRTVLLRTCKHSLQADEGEIEGCVDELLHYKRLHASEENEEDLVYLPSLHYAEEQTAGHIVRLLYGSHRHPLADEFPLSKDERILTRKIRTVLEGQSLSRGQEEAVLAALQHQLVVISGGPGVGKTRAVKAIVDVFRHFGLSASLSAPTGRAASRLANVVSHDAETIHRLLNFDPSLNRFENNSTCPLRTDLIVLDEASMLDITLAHALLQAVPSSAVLVLVGDVDQLPSVGPGKVLQDIIDSKRIKTVFLNEVFRQSELSAIVNAAHQINQGLVPSFAEELSPLARHLNDRTQSAIDNAAMDLLKQQNGRPILNDFQFIAAQNVKDVQRFLVELVSNWIPMVTDFSPGDIQVLTPMRKGDLGSHTLNRLLQETLNPPASGKNQLNCNGYVYREGDKVMQLVNDYSKKVYNGQTGSIVKVVTKSQTRPAHAPARRSFPTFSLDPGVFVDYDHQMLVEYAPEECASLIPAYAITIHKSQGSEFPVVIIPVHLAHSRMLQRNLLYTAVTRAKSMVVLIGTEDAIQAAVEDFNSSAFDRVSLLRRKLILRLSEATNLDKDIVE